MSRVFDFLKNSKKISELIKNPPRDALTTIRLAEIQSKEVKSKKFVQQPVFTSVERLKELCAMCEKLGLPIPGEEDQQN